MELMNNVLSSSINKFDAQCHVDDDIANHNQSYSRNSIISRANQLSIERAALIQA